jgi:shikimate dehydrogenase
VSKTDRYAVLGDPIAHSKSPRIHMVFARQTAQDLLYTAIRVPLEQFTRAVDRFRDDGGCGLNITVPLKLAAWEYADERSPRAQIAGAVNTLLMRGDGSVFGDNTDGVGLVRDLSINHGVALRERRVLLLGAGGASRGVLGPLLDEAPAALVIANRTAARAQALAKMIAAERGQVQGCGFEALAGQPFDVIVNATAAGLSGQTPPLPHGVLAEGGCCYDMVYGDSPTAFERWGLAHGAGVSLNGLGMLVEQAAESFFIWRGVRPATAPVIEALRTG